MATEDRNNAGLYGRVLSPEEKRALKARDFFGFEIRSREEPRDSEASIVPPMEENEAAVILSSAAGFSALTIDVRGDQFTSESDLIMKYRTSAMSPEVDQAIQEIVNEVIIGDDENLPVSLNLDQTGIAESVRERIYDEFDEILNMLSFRKHGHDIFRRWYIDGKIAYHVVVDMANPKSGIKELRPISPMKIRKIKEVEEKVDSRTGARMVTGTEEYFVYSDNGFGKQVAAPTVTATGGATMGLKMPIDSVVYVTSGLSDSTRTLAVSHLHKALRRVNQLRMMEDSLLIYRFSRAPERLVFKIGVGDMGKTASEAYINSIMAKHKNKIKYDSDTGELRDSRAHMHMLENYWLPQPLNGNATEVTTLPGGENLGETTDVEYFQKKLYQALNVPITRMDSEAGFDSGRRTEITRDEIRFQKFVNRLRVQFAEVFKQALRVQLILKGVLSSSEWDEVVEKIIVSYVKDSHFLEYMEIELLQSRLEAVGAAMEYEGVYFSREWIRKTILKQSEKTIEDMKSQIREEKLSNDELPDADRDGAMGGPGGADVPGGISDFGGDRPGGETDLDSNEEEFDDGLNGPTGDAEVLGNPEGAATDLGAEETPELENPEFTDDEDFGDDEQDQVQRA